MLTEALVLIIGALLALVGFLEIAEGHWLPGLVILGLLAVLFLMLLPPKDWGDDDGG